MVPPTNGSHGKGSESTPFMTEWLQEPKAAYALRTPTHDWWTSGLESALGTSFDGERDERSSFLTASSCAAVSCVAEDTQQPTKMTKNVPYDYMFCTQSHANVPHVINGKSGPCQFRARGVPSRAFTLDTRPPPIRRLKSFFVFCIMR